MPYRILNPHAAPDELKRLVVEQIDRATAEIDDAGLDDHETVHQVRKRCKKVRAALRLVRGSLDKTVYQAENAHFRDAAKPLSGVRDAEALIEAFERLMARFGDEIDKRYFSAVRRRLVERRRRLAEKEGDLGETLGAFCGRMLEARERVGSWPLVAEGVDLVASGLRKTYTRARKGLDAARAEPAPEALHEWRKRVKYHWYHCRLLRGTWDRVLRARAREVKALADILGQDHDLVVFGKTIEAAEDGLADVTGTPELLELIKRRRTEYREAAWPLGDRILAEKPKHLVKRFGALWAAWDAETAG